MSRYRSGVPLSVVGILLFAAASLLAQTTTIVTRGGEQYVGAVAATSADTIVIRTSEGVEHAIPVSAISSSSYSAGDATKDYWAVGFAYGMPGRFNILVGRSLSSRFELMMSMGYHVNVVGIEFDGLFRIVSTGPWDHYLVVGSGVSIIGERGWSFMQIGYGMHLKGFNAMVAVSGGEGDFESPQTMFQIGFLHRFL